MANDAALDLNVTPAAFRAARTSLLAAKSNTVALYTEEDTPERAVSQWGDLVDDFIIACQTALQDLYRGAGSPEDAVAAPVGSRYVRTDGGAGTTLYLKESGTGTTGWIAVTTASGASSIAVAGHAARSLIGRAANSSGDAADIVGNGTATARTVPVDDGTSIAFDQLEMPDISHVLYEPVFSTMANNTFANGAEVIDGLSWTAANMTFLGTAEVRTGDGVRMYAGTSLGGASTFTSASQAAPHIYLPLSSLPNFDPRWDLLIEAYFSDLVHESSGEGAFLGLWGPAANPQSTSASRVRTAGLYNGGTARNLRGVSQTTVTTGDESINSYNVVAIRLTPFGHGVCLQGVWASGWPEELEAGISQSTAVGATDPIFSRGSRVVLGMSVANDASPTSGMTCQRMRFSRVG